MKDAASHSIVLFLYVVAVVVHVVALVLFVGAALLPMAASAQTTAPSVPFGQGRPETAGIARTILRDDAKSTVTRVRFKPGAAEPPHTHPYDVIVVPAMAGTIEFIIGGTKVTAVKPGDVQFIPRDVTHQLMNTGKQDFELIAIALK